MQAASRAVSTECYIVGVPRSNQVPVGMGVSFPCNHRHSEGPWHFKIVAARHVVQASSFFFFPPSFLLIIINESYEHLSVF